MLIYAPKQKHTKQRYSNPRLSAKNTDSRDLLFTILLGYQPGEDKRIAPLPGPRHYSLIEHRRTKIMLQNNREVTLSGWKRRSIAKWLKYLRNDRALQTIVSQQTNNDTARVSGKGKGEGVALHPESLSKTYNEDSPLLKCLAALLSMSTLAPTGTTVGSTVAAVGNGWVVWYCSRVEKSRTNDETAMN